MVAQRAAFHKAQFKYVVAEFAVSKLVNVFDACSLRPRKSALFDRRRGK